MTDKTCYPLPISAMAVAVIISGIVNCVVSFLGLLVCMPCMISDGLGSMALVFYLKRSVRGKLKLRRAHAAILGLLSGFIGSIFVLSVLILIFLAFGNLVDMLSSTDLLRNSITGSVVLPLWAVILIGMFIILIKMLISAVATTALSALDSS